MINFILSPKNKKLDTFFWTTKCTLLFLITIIFTALRSPAQIRSQVVDENGNGVSFATVGIPSQNFGVITFEDGTFSLPSNQDFSDSLEISAVGYEKLYISYRDFIANTPDKLILKEMIITLDEVVVYQGQLKEMIIGVKKNSSRNNFNLSSPMEGATVAMLLNTEREPLWIKSTSVVLSKVNMDSFQVRCRIRVSNEKGMPGKDLASKVLLRTVVEENTTLTFDLTDDIFTDQSFFVCFEWVTTKNQFKKLEEIRSSFPVPFLDRLIEENPGLTHTVKEGKRVIFRNSSDEVVKEVALTKNQCQILRDKQKDSPQLKFKIKMKGDNTYYGSSITNKWHKIPHEALISAEILKRN